MKLLTSALLMACLILASASRPAWAGSYFFEAHGGFALINPDDVNDALDRLNQVAGGPFLDQIGSGLDLGLSMGFPLNAELALGLGYSRFSAGSGFSWEGYEFEYDLPADFYEVFLDYIPASGGALRGGAGTSLGLARSAAALKFEDPVEGSEEIPFSGLGFLFTAYVVGEAYLSPTWALSGHLGYRHAIISGLEVDGQTALNPDSPDDELRFNYSGPYLQLGVRFRP